MYMLTIPGFQSTNSSYLTSDSVQVKRGNFVVHRQLMAKANLLVAEQGRGTYGDLKQEQTEGRRFQSEFLIYIC